MAITFRGQAKKLNKVVAEQNQVGFQQKSSASKRQGVGGEDVNLNSAIHEFAKRNESSPAKKKNFYGGTAYFQDGYGGSMANPITSKSRSPFKMNESLIEGQKAKLDSESFSNSVAGQVSAAFKEKEKPQTEDLNKDKPDVSGVDDSAETDIEEVTITDE